MLSPRRHAEPRPRRTPTPFRAALLAALLLAPACTDKQLESLDLPRIELPPAPKPASRPPPSPQALDCDDLPSAAQEQLADLPPGPGLGKALPTEPWNAPPYEVLPGITLPDRVAAKLEQIDRAYERRTKEHLVVTSGTRDAYRQARAMFTRIKLGADLAQIYRNKAAVQEIKRAYHGASGKPAEQVVAAMQAVIQDQIDRGIFISAHLRAGAVDIRNRTMTPAQKRAFAESAAEVAGVELLEESKPPHYHLQID